MRCTSGVLAGVPLLLSLVLAPAASAAGPYVQVPVVLDVHGLNGSHYTSDLTVVNVGTIPSDLEITLLTTSPLPAIVGPFLPGATISPGRQYYLPDVVNALRGMGAELPTDGTSIIGTLVVRLISGDDTPPFVGSRVSTPNPAAAVGGSFGTYSMGTPVGQGEQGASYVYGLRENDSYRTNLAFVHAGGGANKTLKLAVQVYDGQTGHPAPTPIDVTLEPGQWYQIPSVLSAYGFAQGWAKVMPVSGNDRYLTYAVVNDGGIQGGGTSDGSWIDPNPTEGTLPVVLSSGTYRTELILARPIVGSFPDAITLSYSSSDSLTDAGVGGAAHLTLAPGTQIVVPDAIQLLRDNGVAIPTGTTQGGVLRVTGGVALARIYSPNPDATVGGTFGVAFRALPIAERGKSEAWVYGLRQDAAVRSNLAIANTAPFGSPALRLQFDVYDAQSGRVVTTLSRQLVGSQFYQWNAPLATLGVKYAYARARCSTPNGGTCDFIAYGVVNDGSAPGRGTSDGSFIPMVNVQ